MKLTTLLASFAFSIAAFAQPAIHSVTPPIGPATGGTEVLIHGSDFSDACPPITCMAMAIYFGDVRAPEATLIDSNTIRATTPPHFPGVVTVRYEQGLSSVSLLNGFTYGGQPPETTYERVLLPVFVPPVRGAFGSEFRTEFHATTTGAPVSLYGVFRTPNCGPIACTAEQPIVLQAQEVLRPDDIYYTGTPGRFLYLPKEDVASLVANLRVYDTSTAAANFGTEIPVVRQSDFRDTITLLGIPRDPRFRTKVRVYSTQLSSLRVTIDGLAPFDVSLPSSRDIHEPTYAEFMVDTPGTGTATLRITKNPIISSVVYIPPPFWAFATVTNNETQVLTTISPQP